MSKKHQLEIACFNYESTLIAQLGGADRIELCNHFQEGGTTPDYTIAAKARQHILINLFVMIRPRGGNFVYTDDEFEQMKKDIAHFKSTGIDGFVFGILHSDNTINLSQNKTLVELASPMPCSFHRAFDRTINHSHSLEAVIECGFQTLLTSGFASSAMLGLHHLTSLIKQAGNRICIMPGGGVRSDNIDTIKNNTKASYYHSSAIIEGETANFDEVKALKHHLI